MIICLGSYYIVYLPAKDVKPQLKSTNPQKTNTQKTQSCLFYHVFYRVNIFSDNFQRSASNVSSQHILGFTFIDKFSVLELGTFVEMSRFAPYHSYSKFGRILVLQQTSAHVGRQSQVIIEVLCNFTYDACTVVKLEFQSFSSFRYF